MPNYGVKTSAHGLWGTTEGFGVENGCEIKTEWKSKWQQYKRKVDTGRGRNRKKRSTLRRYSGDLEDNFEIKIKKESAPKILSEFLKELAPKQIWEKNMKSPLSPQPHSLTDGKHVIYVCPIEITNISFEAWWSKEWLNKKQWEAFTILSMVASFSTLSKCFPGVGSNWAQMLYHGIYALYTYTTYTTAYSAKGK